MISHMSAHRGHREYTSAACHVLKRSFVRKEGSKSLQCSDRDTQELKLKTEITRGFNRRQNIAKASS